MMGVDWFEHKQQDEPPSGARTLSGILDSGFFIHFFMQKVCHMYKMHMYLCILKILTV